MNPEEVRPEISGGTVGEQIDGATYPTVGVETTRGPSTKRFTYWFFWPYDQSHDDGVEDYEPATLVYRSKGGKDVLEGGTARVHFAKARFKNLLFQPHPQVRFANQGHTPVFHTRSPGHDIAVEEKGDSLDLGRRLWVLGQHELGNLYGWNGTATRDYELRPSSCPPSTSKARDAPYF